MKLIELGGINTLYVLKFLSAFLIPPGLWILTIFIMSILLYRKSKAWGTAWLILCFFIYLSTTSIVADNLVRIVERQYDSPEVITGDVVVLLTSGATSETPGTDGKGLPTDETSGRILAAAALFQKYKLPIIIAGGQVYPDGGNEAEISKQSLLSIGVPESYIIVENASRSTAENAAQVKIKLEERRFQAPILVTSAIHMPRAVYHFEKVGVKVTPYPTAYLASHAFVLHSGHFYPSDHALAKTGHAFRELYGFIASPFID